MVHFFCALYEEARFLIESFQLKKNPAIHPFPVYENAECGLDKIVLAITGPGAVSAAAAVGYLAAKDIPKEEQLLVNIGSCGAGEKFPVGSVILGHTLMDEQTGHSFYPDILFAHPFREAVIRTNARTCAWDEIAQQQDQVFDMEAAAIYRAGSHFYRPDQMLFLKVVSDHGIQKENDVPYSPDALTAVMSQAGEEIVPFLKKLVQSQEQERPDHIRTDAQRLKEELHCSVTMAAELEQLMHYAYLAGIETDALLETDRCGGLLPCKDKKEGKRYLEQLKQRIL